MSQQIAYFIEVVLVDPFSWLITLTVFSPTSRDRCVRPTTLKAVPPMPKRTTAR